MLTSLSDVPQRPQDLHSIHCQGYFFTDIIMFGVNCRQDGCPGARQIKWIGRNCKAQARKLM